MKSERIDWLDKLKGIAIILVVFGHAFIPSESAIYIYIRSFNMSLFFFISGYIFQIEKFRSLKEFTIKKIKLLILPYFIFSIITYIFWFFNRIPLTNSYDNTDVLIKSFVGIFYGTGNGEWTNYFSAPLWFLPCLFVTSIAYYIIKKNISNRKILALSLLIFSILGYLGSLYLPIELPWGINIMFTAIVFYGIGNLLKDFKLSIHLTNLQKIFFFITVTSVSIIFSQLNGGVNMHLNYYNNYFYFYIAAFTGIMTYIMISQININLNILKYLGQNSLLIMSLHRVTFIGGVIILEILKIIDLNIKTPSYLASIIYLISSLLLLTPIIYAINNYLPFLLGKKFKS